MKRRKLILVMTLVVALSASSSNVWALSHAFSSEGVSGHNTNYITLDVNAGDLTPVVMTAGNTLSQAQGLSDMAKAQGCIAAINGTYFEAYEGTPVPWGTIIKDGKVLHVGNMGSTVGITSSGKLIIDNLSINFKGYINGEHRSIPWRINHPSTEQDAITIFTPEYGTQVMVEPGALGAVVVNGKVERIANSSFTVPSNGFVILYNSAVAHLVTERFNVGDEVYYEAEFATKHTSPSDWADVQQAIGAGPSLIINGQVTADGAAEGFWEAKINTDKGSRTFIGNTNEGKILIGTISSATLKEAAAVCQSLGLVNAMCLDGGGSTSLYYNGKSITQGRAVNNGLGFIYKGAGQPSVADTSNYVKPNSAKVLINGEEVNFEAYTIGGNNYFKLRDLANALENTEKSFEVSWDNANSTINLISNTPYTEVGGELAVGDGIAKKAEASSAVTYKDGQKIDTVPYKINDNNYFKLRDIGVLFDFGVDYDNVAKAIIIDTSKAYIQ